MKENVAAPVSSSSVFMKEVIEKEPFECSNESPSKRFRAVATVKDDETTEREEGHKSHVSSTRRRRSFQPDQIASPAMRNMSLESTLDTEVFIALDGRDTAMFGFCTTPNARVSAKQHGSRPAESHSRHVVGSTPHHLRQSPLNSKGARSPRDPPVPGDSCWV